MKILNDSKFINFEGFDNSEAFETLNENEAIILICSVLFNKVGKIEALHLFNLYNSEPYNGDDFIINADGSGSCSYMGNYYKYSLNFNIDFNDFFVDVDFDEYEEQSAVEDIKNKAETLQDLINQAQEYQEDIEAAKKNLKDYIEGELKENIDYLTNREEIKNWLEKGEISENLATALLYFEL